jgi:hypothetical protein
MDEAQPLKPSRGKQPGFGSKAPRERSSEPLGSPFNVGPPSLTPQSDPMQSGRFGQFTCCCGACCDRLPRGTLQAFLKC